MVALVAVEEYVGLRGRVDGEMGTSEIRED